MLSKENKPNMPEEKWRSYRGAHHSVDEYDLKVSIKRRTATSNNFTCEKYKFPKLVAYACVSLRITSLKLLNTS